MTGRSSAAHPGPVLGIVKGATRRYAATLRAALDTPCARPGVGSYEGTAKDEERSRPTDPSGEGDLLGQSRSG
jgi:hypothetical protein